jgi:hypothetical protein
MLDLGAFPLSTAPAVGDWEGIRRQSPDSPCAARSLVQQAVAPDTMLDPASTQSLMV